VNYVKLEDTAILQLIAHQNPEALGELYDRYGRLVYSIALNAVNDQATAEEITQDVFLRVWENAKTYQIGRGKVSTWIISIARHRSIDMLRHRGARLESRIVYLDDLHPAVLPQSSDLENSWELSHRREQVRVALGSLPEEQKTALGMAYFHGYTHREIANKLNLPLGTVKTRIRLAMQKLRSLLEEVAMSE
jgi:RNA polymerase sigma-70 factor (ECF subfamily)